MENLKQELDTFVGILDDYGIDLDGTDENILAGFRSELHDILNGFGFNGGPEIKPLTVESVLEVIAEYELWHDDIDDTEMRDKIKQHVDQFKKKLIE